MPETTETCMYGEYNELCGPAVTAKMNRKNSLYVRS